MSVLQDWFGGSALLVAGGSVMVVILLLSTVMWWLILARYRHFAQAAPVLASRLISDWRMRAGTGVARQRRLREALLRSYARDNEASLATIDVLSATLPMVGLLGTVIGMVHVFDVLMVFGTGNVRGMANGISQALVTTLGGLTTALSGLYFVSDLRSRAARAQEQLASHLGYATP